jgi:hypothetical protein
MVACPACAEEPRPPPAVQPAAAVREPETPTIPARLRTLPSDDPVVRSVQDAMYVELRAVGFALADGGGAEDVDLLLTVAASASPDGRTRTTVTLSPTVGGHAMEDVSGHFLRSDQKLDPITIREVCQRVRRHYRRFRRTLTGTEE